MDLGIKGKRALVAGASKGLGLASAKALAAEGAKLYLLSRSEESLLAARKEIENEFKVDIETFPCDLLDAGSRKAAMDKIEMKWGGVDILVHNVGGPKATSAEDTGIGDWQDGFDRLFKPVVDLNARFVPAMKEQKWGRIIAVTSLSVMEPIANLAVSNGIRSAVTAMLKTLSDELATYNITVNCVAPGMILTDRTDELMKSRIAKSGKSEEQYMQDYLQSIPARRLGRPEEFAAVLCFVASEKASYVTGSTLCVDGGKRRSTY